MFFEMLFVAAIIIIAAGFYWFGNYSIWGKLANRHIFPYSAKATSQSDKYVNIGIRVNDNWQGGVRAKCYCNETGIALETNRYLTIFTPSVFIPWNDVKGIKISNKGFMGTSRLEIILKVSGVSILVPKSCNLYFPTTVSERIIG